MSSEERETLSWIKNFVIRHNLCPFAAAPLRRNQVALKTSPEREPAAAFYWAGTQVQWQLEQPAFRVETTLLIFPAGLTDFEDFLGFVGALEQLLEDSGADEHLQLAHFHPKYCFEGVRGNDPANATNRSPYPTIQLLRATSVAEAVHGYPDIASIPDRNIQLLRRIAAATDE